MRIQWIIAGQSRNQYRSAGLLYYSKVGSLKKLRERLLGCKKSTDCRYANPIKLVRVVDELDA
ncbi:MAG TPA: hypothetical protein VIY68_19855 [Steroidobacteraceae bacterium]